MGVVGAKLLYQDIILNKMLRYSIILLMLVLVSCVQKTEVSIEKPKEVKEVQETIEKPTGWSKLPELSIARSEVAAAAASGKIVVIGGLVGNREATRQVEIFNPSKNAWEKGPDYPFQVHHASAVGIGSKVYVFGGYKLPSGATNKAYALDIEKLEEGWKELKEMPTPRGALGAAAIGNRIYVVGGSTGTKPLRTVEVYDVLENSWSFAPGLPSPKEHAAVVALDAKVFVIGGRNEESFTLSTVEAFDIAKNSWESVKEMPTGRSGLSAAVANGRIHVLGGESYSRTFGEHEVYEPFTNEWLSLPNLPTPRHGLAAVELDGKIYAIAGGERPGASYSGIVEVFDPKKLVFEDFNPCTLNYNPSTRAF